MIGSLILKGLGVRKIMAEIGHRDPTGKQRPASDRPRKSPVPTGF